MAASALIPKTNKSIADYFARLKTHTSDGRVFEPPTGLIRVFWFVRGYSRLRDKCCYASIDLMVDKLDIPKSTIHRYLKRLVAAGLITSHGKHNKKTVMYTIPPEIEASIYKRPKVKPMKRGALDGVEIPYSDSKMGLSNKTVPRYLSIHSSFFNEEGIRLLFFQNLERAKYTHGIKNPRAYAVVCTKKGDTLSEPMMDKQRCPECHFTPDLCTHVWGEDSRRRYNGGLYAELEGYQ